MITIDLKFEFEPPSGTRQGKFSLRVLGTALFECYEQELTEPQRLLCAEILGKYAGGVKGLGEAVDRRVMK